MSIYTLIDGTSPKSNLEGRLVRGGRSIEVFDGKRWISRSHYELGHSALIQTPVL